MRSHLSEAEARGIASKFLSSGRYNCENPDPNGPKLGEEHFTYRVSGNELVYEFPIFTSEREHGFILISGTERLPPVLEYAAEGPTLRLLLEKSLEYNIPARVAFKSWIYGGPLEYLAETEQEDELVYVSVPHGRLHRTKNLISRFFKSASSPSWIANRWKHYDQFVPHARLIPVPSCVDLKLARAPRLQQTCQGAAREDDLRNPIQNYCTPACIAGCTAVGWAMLAGTFAGMGLAPELDPKHWTKDWHTFPYPPRAGDPIVNAKIWEIRSLMNTRCDGLTDTNDSWRGEQLFRSYGINWAFGHEPINYDTTKQIVAGAMPFLLLGTRVWLDGAPAEGHAIIVRGYEDDDRHIKVCLGWGDYFSDIWIPFDELRNPFAHWVRSW